MLNSLRLAGHGAITPRMAGTTTPRMTGSHFGGTTPRPTNPLLTRDDVGRAKPSCYDLPSGQHAFGKMGNQDAEGAREVSMRWVPHTPSRGREAHVPDFITFNKKAASARACNPKELCNYRKDQDYLNLTPREPLRPATSMRAKDLIPSDVVPGFTYGKAGRPSTPIEQVISARFAEQPEPEYDSFYASMRETKTGGPRMMRKITPTAASRGHASAAAHKKAAMEQEDSKELFKLSRFKRIQAKVCTSHKKSFGYATAGSFFQAPDAGVDMGQLTLEAEGGQEATAAAAE